MIQAARRFENVLGGNCAGRATNPTTTFWDSFRQFQFGIARFSHLAYPPARFATGSRLAVRDPRAAISNQGTQRTKGACALNQHAAVPCVKGTSYHFKVQGTTDDKQASQVACA